MVTPIKDENIIYIHVLCSGVCMDQTIGGNGGRGEGVYKWSGQNWGGQVLVLNEIIQHYR